MSKIQWTKGPEQNAEFYYGKLHNVDKVFIVIGPSKGDKAWRLCSWYFDNSNVTLHETKDKAIQEAENIYDRFLETFGLTEIAA